MPLPLRIFLILPLLALTTSAAEPSADDLAFFESKVRPVLVQRFYECHSHEKKTEGGLTLDSLEAWQAGGDTAKVS